MTKEGLDNNFRGKCSPEEFSKIVDDHIGMVTKMVFKILLNEQDTKDVVQEAFVIAYRKLDSFREESQLSTWISRIARNQAYEFLRKQRRTKKGFDAAEFSMSKQAKPIGNPENIIKSVEVFEEVNEAIMSLPDKQRKAIQLVSIEGKEVDEAAQILDCSPSSIYRLIHKARTNLKGKLAHLK